MTTMALLTLNKQCKKACEEIYVMSNTLLNMLLEDIRQHVGCLFQLSADVAELDLILSLAQISSNPEYVRPSFGTKLELINSLHPIMELFNRDLPVPNDVQVLMKHHDKFLIFSYFNRVNAQKASYAYNFHLITGPNMSGKSTYLKQIVLLQIMAQIGSYVPATKATFRIADRIFCRMSSRDDAELNASTYVLEMKEVQYILQSVTPNSLVVLDELCRHTAVEEGSAIAWSIYEKLSLTSAYTFAATHFLHLTALSNMYHNIETHYFETKNAEPENKTKELHLIYTHKLMPGIGSTDHYGIALAEVCSLPKCVTTKAREYASRQSTQNNLGSFTSSRSWEKSCYDAVVQLRALLDDNNFTFANVINIMKQLDLSKQPKQQPAKHAQGPAQFTSVPQNSQASRKRQKCEDDRNLDAVPKNNLTIETNNNASLTELPNQTNKNDTVPEEMEYEPTQIVDRAIVVAHPADHDLKTDLRLTDNVIKSFSLPNANVADEETSIIFNPCPSFQLTKLPPLESFDSTTTEIKSLAQQSGSITDDPLFYVRTSFTATSQKTVTLSETDKENQSQGEASLTFATNSIATSSLISRISSQGYHDYCLSQKDFDISQSQSISSDLARITARVKEAAIFRQIEGSSFDEEEFLNSIQQVPLNFTPPNDEDVVMTST
ncbi:MutS protein-like protein [Ooceraea biroi]|uniref:MutS protein-like protein n=1 Tax=Ooceraea biroi TaxID=2015173 RepID=A0A026WCE9_OOCBI|nr:MutS protein-like protein [Ooceraea biroi]